MARGWSPRFILAFLYSDITHTSPLYESLDEKPVAHSRHQSMSIIPLSHHPASELSAASALCTAALL